MRSTVTWIVAVAVLSAQPAVYAEKHSQGADQLRSVELNEKNLLVGKVVDVTGAPVAGQKVVVRSQSDLNAVQEVVVSGRDGRFEVAGLHTGRVVFDVENESYGCRVWNHGIAPPKSLTSISVVPQSHIVRGQGECKPSCMDRLRCMSPQAKICLGLLVAAAIAIPIALADDDDAS